MTDNTVAGFYDKGYDYNARAPYFIERSELTEEEYRKLTHSECVTVC